MAAYAAWAAGRIATKDRRAAIQSQQEAQQPYVWADFRTDNKATFFQVVVVNEGPTVARNVRVTFDPPLTTSQAEWAKRPEVIASMPPGRVLAWRLDSVHAVFAKDSETPHSHAVRVTGEGPYGALPVNEYTLDLHDYSLTATRPATEGVALGNELRDAAKVVAEAIRAGRRETFRTRRNASLAQPDTQPGDATEQTTGDVP